jgi:hypothetical protein
MRGFTRFPRFGNIPQSDLPGEKAQSSRTAFTPKKQPDIFNPYRTQNAPDMSGGGENPIGTPEQMLDVRHVYDSRPLFSYDFWWEEQFYDGIRQANPIVVPEGQTWVLRQVELDITRLGGGTGFEIDFWGGNPLDLGFDSNFFVLLQILVDGVPTPQWTPYGSVEDPSLPGESLRGVPLLNALVGPVSIPTFIIVASGQSISVNIPNFIDTVGTDFNTIAKYYGNVLQSGGSDARLDVLNQTPLPVKGS